MFSQTCFSIIESSNRVGGGETLMVWGVEVEGMSSFGWFVEVEGVSRLGSRIEIEVENEPIPLPICMTCSSSSSVYDISMLDISRIGLIYPC